MRTYSAFATGFALIFALLFLHQCNRTQDSELTREAIRSVWKADHAIADSAKAKLFGKIEQLNKNQVRKDSLHTANNAAQKRTIAYYIRKERNSRPDTLTVTLQDTIYLLADNLVDSLENQIQGLKTLDSLKSEKYDSLIEIQARQIFKCDSLLDKALNLKPDSNWGVGGTAGVASVISNGQLHAGFGFSGGVTYRIPANKISIRKLFRKKR